MVFGEWIRQSVIDGVFAPSDAKALNAPLIAQRETAQLKLASMPQRRELPAVEKLDPEKFRAGVLQAWTDKPIDLRREALDRLLERITLDEGGVHVQYAVKDEPPFRHQAPAGPPWGSWGQWEVEVETVDVVRPRTRFQPSSSSFA